MARRQVMGSARDSRGNITALCHPTAEWSPRSTRDVINDIADKRHTYVVTAPPFPITSITVVRAGGQRFLRSVGDGALGNNLDLLPDCASMTEQLPVRRRRNAADLTNQEWARFVAAIKELRNRFPEVDGMVDAVDWWFKQDEIHAATHVHSQPSFLPWHRHLVNRFEALLQEIDPTVALHYWDWTTDPRRTPNAAGRRTDIMTADRMGSDSGPLGAPYQSFSDPTADPHRDSSTVDRADRAVLPPRAVTRKMPAGKGPQDVKLADLDWSDRPGGRPPQEATDAQARIPDDRDVLEEGYGSPAATAWDRMRTELTLAHGWAHRYVGGDIAEGHRSFRDPLVFLLHSNVDRLWASWQLRQTGDHRQWAWRLDGAEMYGSMRDEPDLKREMSPWSGSNTVSPWKQKPEPVRPTDAEVVRPPLYDRYAYDDELCVSWTTMLLARKLPAGDVIQATLQHNVCPPGTVEVMLRLAPRVQWWKGIRVPTADGTAMIEVERSRRVAAVSVPTAALRGRQLVIHRRQWIVPLLSTGKRIVYRVGDLDFVADGGRLVLDWLQD